jgi:hypothetical protein
VLVALSAPKNVQDAVLADPVRAPHVDIIDIRYWAYTAGDGVYAPEGGKNLAPRQHLRQTRLKSGGFAAIAKAVREYRTRYPDKAVTYYADMNCPSSRDGWAVLIGGGSIPNVRLSADLAAIVPNLRPDENVVDAPGQWCIADDGNNYLIYCEFPGKSIDARLRGAPHDYRVHWINTQSGEQTDGAPVSGSQITVPAKSQALWLERIAD